MDPIEHINKEGHQRMLNWLELATRTMKRAIHQTGAKDSEELLNSIGGTVDAPNGSIAGIAELHFSAHGRFLDMGAGRGWHKGVRTSNRENSNRSPRRKGKKVYSKPIYGTVSGLAQSLSHVYIDAMVGSARKLNSR